MGLKLEPDDSGTDCAAHSRRHISTLARKMKITLNAALTTCIVSLLVIVAFTSYLSPLSLTWSPDREISEKINKGFTYKDTMLYFVGTPDVVDSPNKNGIRIGIDSMIKDSRHFQIIHVDEHGNRKSSVIQKPSSSSETRAYIDDDGDGLPEWKVLKEGDRMQRFKLDSASWILTEDNQIE